MVRCYTRCLGVLVAAVVMGCSATSTDGGGDEGGSGDGVVVPVGDVPVVDFLPGDGVVSDPAGSDGTGPKTDVTGPDDGTSPADGTGPKPDGTSPDGSVTTDTPVATDVPVTDRPATDAAAEAETPSNGAKTCMGIFDCWDTCADTDDACVEACITGAEPTAQTELNDLEQCAKTNCSQFNPNAGQALEFQACFRSKCSSQVEKCFTGGTGTCPDIFDCLNKCSQSDATCQNNCVQDGTLKAQSVFLDFQVCAKANNCTTQACVDQKCQAENQACGAN